MKNNIIETYKDSKEYISDMIKEGYLSDKYEPIKCPNCKSNKYEDKIVDRNEITIMEMKRICKECKFSFGYWVTGYWQIF